MISMAGVLPLDISQSVVQSLSSEFYIKIANGDTFIRPNDSECYAGWCQTLTYFVQRSHLCDIFVGKMFSIFVSIQSNCLKAENFRGRLAV
jgi:hypothetical protein